MKNVVLLFKTLFKTHYIFVIFQIKLCKSGPRFFVQYTIETFLPKCSNQNLMTSMEPDQYLCNIYYYCVLDNILCELFNVIYRNIVYVKTKVL